MRLSNLTIATALHELGYDGEYKSFYMPDGTLEDIEYKVLTGQPIYGGEDHIPCPRLDDAAYWLRDKHGIVINVSYADFYDPDEWFFIILNKSDCKTLFCKLECYTTYEDALETAVIKAIEFINNPQTPQSKC